MSIPGAGNPLLLGGGAQYKIERSLRFNSADSAYLNRTPASAGNRKTWTWSGWVKRSALTNNQQAIFSLGAYPADLFEIRFDSGEILQIDNTPGSATKNLELRTSAVFRDTSAWYNIVFTLDTTQATASDRGKLYVNGQQITAFSTGTYPSQNADLNMNTAVVTRIGNRADNGIHFSGYLADIHFIDGQALTPSSFGEFDTNNVWQPKAYSGSYGTNGFHLPFNDNSAATATTLGKDTSGNGNNWTPNNLSVTAGAGNDSLVDSPTNYGTDDGLGGSVRGNYCTINPLDQRFTDNGTISNGNLDYVQSSTGSRAARCTIGVSSGKWYWEFTHLGGNASHGISKASSSLASYPGGADADGWSWFAGGGIYNNAGTTGAYSSLTYATNDVIGVALDLDAGTLVYYKNGASQGTAASGLTGTWFPSFGSSSVAVVSLTANFGQRPFAYTAPSGFKALCTANLPTPTIANGATAMDVLLWSGTGGNRSFSSLSMSPDFVWIKQRNQAYTVGHQIYDIVRGAGSLKQLDSSNTTAEGGGNTNQYGYLSSFDSAGFSVTAGSTDSDYVNKSGVTYAAWCWDAGTTTSSNGSGSITSQVRANASAGFSVATWTGSGSGSVTVGHGLGVAPQFFIVKDRSNARNWLVYHVGMGATRGMQLNLTTAQSGADAGYWNNTAPTSTVATIGTYANESANYVGYFWAPQVGYSSMGSYVGNGSSTSGPFVFLGFRPKFLLVKSSTGAENWDIYDSSRGSYNLNNLSLQPNLSGAEYNAGSLGFDFLSNGFRSIGGSNTNGATYIYYAVAESPFAYARAR